MTETKTLQRPDAEITNGIDGPLPTADGQRPLLMIGQPMDSSGFTTLVALLPERTVARYDPRGLGRSVRSDGTQDQAAETQAGDVHALIEALARDPSTCSPAVAVPSRRLRWWRRIPTTSPRSSRTNPAHRRAP